MNVCDIMTKKAITIVPENTLAEAARLLSLHRIGFVLVVHDNQAVGVLSEGDIVRWTAKGIDFNRERAQDHMHAPVLSVSESSDVFDAYDELMCKKVRHLAVVDRHNKLVGVLTMSNFLASMGVEHIIELQTVEDIMLPRPLTVIQDTSMSEAIACMNHEKHAILALDGDNISGILTSRDVTRLQAQDVDISNSNIAEYMSTPVQCISSSAFIPEANTLMKEHRLRHLAVVDHKGKLVGLLTISAVLGSMEGKYVDFLRSVLFNIKNATNLQSEQHAALFEHNPNAVCMFNMDGSIARTNPASTLLTGYSKKTLQAMNLTGLLPHMSYEIGGTIYHNEIPTISLNTQTDLRCKSGEDVTIYLSLIPILVDGQQTGACGVMYDISERLLHEERRLQRAIREAEHETRELHIARLELQARQADAASKAKTDFLTVISHELRTPLHGVIGLQSLLKKEATYLQPDHQQYLHLAQNSSQVLQSLIEDIIDLSKIEAGKLEIKTTPFNLPEMLLQSIMVFLMPANEKDLQLSMTYQNIPQYIHADRLHIRQVLLNLTGNAIKYTKQGHVSIHVSFETRDQHGQLTISIEDSGIGISEDQLVTIFEPFVQLTDSPDRTGTGLGTTIAKCFIQAMGGSIDVHSIVGHGSTFMMQLPVDAVDDQRISKQVDLLEELKNNSDDSNIICPPLRILLAEDDDISRMIARNTLVHAGLYVELATHGLEAWEKIQNNDYDLLLTDIRMPGLTGIELTLKIRKFEQQTDAKHLRILGLSAHAMEENVQECMAAGMDGFIPKPIDPDKLLHTLCIMHHHLTPEED